MEKDASSQLSQHTKEFGKKEVVIHQEYSVKKPIFQVLKVGTNVYVAIGYGLANSVMIEGEDGLVIIDTLESNEVAR